MNLPILLLPNGLHLVLNNLSSFKFQDCDEKYFEFIYTTVGLDKEFVVKIPNEFKVLLKQKINYIFDVSEIKHK